MIKTIDYPLPEPVNGHMSYDELVQIVIKLTTKDGNEEVVVEKTMNSFSSILCAQLINGCTEALYHHELIDDELGQANWPLKEKAPGKLFVTYQVTDLNEVRQFMTHMVEAVQSLGHEIH